MYKSVWEFTRPNTSIAWPPADQNLNTLRSATTGFVGKEVTFSPNGLTKITKTVWNSENDAMAFMASNSEAIQSANDNLVMYCEDRGITVVRSVEA